jgi:hypothetical protein
MLPPRLRLTRLPNLPLTLRQSPPLMLPPSLRLMPRPSLLPKARRPKATDGSDRLAARLTGARLMLSRGRGAAVAVRRPFASAGWHPDVDHAGVRGFASAAPAKGKILTC